MRDMWDAHLAWILQHDNSIGSKGLNVTALNRDQYLASVEPVEGMRWVKASERLVESKPGQKVIIKYKGVPDLLINYRGIMCFFSEDRITSFDYTVYDDSWSDIEWLDENTNQ